MRRIRPWTGSMDDWLTTAQAAALARYHSEHIRELARSGQVKARKFGPVWMIDRASLLAYAEEMAAAGQRRGPKSRG